MKNPNDAVIVAYKRTAQSRSNPGNPGKDVFASLRSDQLSIPVVHAAIKQAGIVPIDIDTSIWCSALGVKEQFTFGGRLPIFVNGLPHTLAARFVDQQCGSAMAAVHWSALEIMAGFADVCLDVGMEHMTRVPMATLATEAIIPNPSLFDADAQEGRDMAVVLNMGKTAEKLAAQEGYTREEMDEWGLRSHDLALAAREQGFFKDEIVPIEVQNGSGTVIIDEDQNVRKTSLKKMAGLAPAFIPNGVITAANSSPLNAGATVMILMSRKKAEEMGVKPMAKILSIGTAGVDPTIMGIGPVPASQKALDKAGLKAEKIDFWEINEAFAVVALHAIKTLGLDPDTVNVMGGGCAIGHPLGATGIRLIGTLARILEHKNAQYGCANACIGGGQGIATIIEREVV